MEHELVDFEDGRKAIITVKDDYLTLLMPYQTTELSKNDVLYLISYLSRAAAQLEEN
jgi:hypothetical protein